MLRPLTFSSSCTDRACVSTKPGFLAPPACRRQARNDTVAKPRARSSGGGGIGLMDFGGAEVGEEGGQDADGGKKRADVVDKIDAGMVGKFA